MKINGEKFIKEMLEKVVKTRLKEEQNSSQMPSKLPKPGYKWNWTGNSWDQVKITKNKVKKKVDVNNKTVKKKISKIDNIIKQAMKRFDIPNKYFDKLKKDILNDYKDSDINKLTMNDIAEIIDASGYPSNEDLKNKKNKKNKKIIKRNKDGNIIYKKDESGNEYKYNDNGRLIEYKDIDGSIHSYKYDDKNRLIYEKNPYNTKIYKYDDAKGETTIKTSDGDIYKYNKYGQLIYAKSPGEKGKKYIHKDNKTNNWSLMQKNWGKTSKA